MRAWGSRSDPARWWVLSCPVYTMLPAATREVGHKAGVVMSGAWQGRQAPASAGQGDGMQLVGSRGPGAPRCTQGAW